MFDPPAHRPEPGETAELTPANLRRVMSRTMADRSMGPDNNQDHALADAGAVVAAWSAPAAENRPISSSGSAIGY